MAPAAKCASTQHCSEGYLTKSGTGGAEHGKVQERGRERGTPKNAESGGWRFASVQTSRQVMEAPAGTTSGSNSNTRGTASQPASRGE